jgi:transposase
MGFQELTDEQWAFIAPLWPPRAKTGRPRVDDRKILARGGEKRGEGVGIDGHKKRKGTKARVLVNEDGLPLRVVVGLGMSTIVVGLRRRWGACE